MLQNKDTHSLSELKTDFVAKGLKSDFMLGSLKCFKLSAANQCFQGLKAKGYPLNSLFACLLSLPFLGKKSVNHFVQHPLESFTVARKDCFYRMKNNSAIHWRHILWKFAKQFLKASQQANVGNLEEQNPRCLIFDDILLTKCGRRIELVSKVWDHVSNRSLLGFKIPVCLYYDGISCLPVDFSLHREKGKNKQKPYGMKKSEVRKVSSKSRQKSSQGYKRVKEAGQSKIDMALKMIRRAVGKGIAIDYVLMDSWFTCWAFIELLAQLNANLESPIRLIGMYKCSKTRFDRNSQSPTHGQLREMAGANKPCRKLGYYYRQATVEWKGQPIKLFFCKEGKRGKWKVLLTTDKSLTFIEMIKIYQTRWAIEVFFKEAKQHLGLGKCQSNDFDAQIADTTLVMIQYMIITLRWRFENYESKGALFEQDLNKAIAFRLADRLWGLLLQLAKLIETFFDGIDSEEVITKMVHDQKALKLIEHFWKDPIDCKIANQT